MTENDNSNKIIPAIEHKVIEDLYDEELSDEILAAWPWIGYVDAAMATELLKANKAPVLGEQGTNRKLSLPTVQAYAREMLDGNWVFTHQGAAFDQCGNMKDGQHRLEALVLASATKPDIRIPMVIWYEIPDYSQDAIDTVRRRVPGDFLAMDGHASGPRLSKIIQLIDLYDRREPGKINHEYWKARVFTAMYIRARGREIEAAQPGELNRAARIGGVLMKTFTPSAVGAAWFLLLRNNDRAVVEEFFEALATGANLDARDPRLGIRNWRTNLRNDNVRTEGYMLLAALLKSFNQWRAMVSGATDGINYFYIRHDEQFPVV